MVLQDKGNNMEQLMFPTRTISGARAFGPIWVAKVEYKLQHLISTHIFAKNLNLD